MTATRQHRQRSWRMMSPMRRAVGTLRCVNDELLRANEAIFRPAGTPPASIPAGTSAAKTTALAGGAEAVPTEHTGRAA